MAKVTTMRLVDDLDGSRADETVEFGLDGRRYEIDLTRDHAQALRAALTGYVHAGRLVPAAGNRPDNRRDTDGTDLGGDRSRNQAIRAWARRHGIPVSGRGRISHEVLAAFHTAVASRPAHSDSQAHQQCIDSTL